MKKELLLAILLLSFLAIRGQNIPNKCYRGFIDAGYSVGVGDYEFGRVEVNTSHGYQFNPYLFLGAGIGLHLMSSYETSGMDIPLDVRDEKTDVPIFANIRCNFIKKNISPFIDVKGGTFVTNNGGMYINVSAGCRFSINEKQAVNMSIGYASEKLEFETFYKFANNMNMNYVRRSTMYGTEAITIKIGVEF